VPHSAAAPTITYEDFRRVDVRVGTIVAVEDFPEARRPAWRLQVDFGPQIGVKRSSAQLVANYTKEALLGRQVAAVVNFPAKQIGKVLSEVLVLGFPDSAGEVRLIVPEAPVPNGGRLY
jgi:tRNA-binding protein